MIQFRREAVGFVELSRRLDQACRKVGVYAAIALLVGIGQRAAGDVAPDAQVVKLGLMRTQAGLDVAQAFAISQLREGHAEELIEMRERLGRIFGRIALHTAAKRVKG